MEVSTPCKNVPVNLSLESPEISPIRPCSNRSINLTDKNIIEKPKKEEIKRIEKENEKNPFSAYPPLDPIFTGNINTTEEDPDELPLQKLFKLVQRVSVFFESGSDSCKYEKKNHLSKRKNYQKIPSDVFTSAENQGSRYKSRRTEKGVDRKHEIFSIESSYQCPKYYEDFEKDNSERNHVEVDHEPGRIEENIPKVSF